MRFNPFTQRKQDPFSRFKKTLFGEWELMNLRTARGSQFQHNQMKRHLHFKRAQKKEKEKNRASLKRMGLSTNVYEWGK